MMKCKFKIGQRAIYQNEEVTVKIPKRDFVSKQNTYRLEDGRVVYEKDLEAIVAKTASIDDKSRDEEEILELRMRYQNVHGKEVSQAKKNNKEWMSAKIIEAIGEEAFQSKSDLSINIDESKGQSIADERYLVLKELSKQGKLEQFIEEQELGINPDDYNADELLTAVCEEMKIEIPKED